MRRTTFISSEERQEIVNTIQNRIDELTFSELTSQSNKVKNQELDKIRITIRKYLEDYTLMENKVTMATKNLNLVNNNKNLSLYILYKTFLNNDMTSLLQDGYILIENLRKTFTGTEITYEIGMEYSVGKNNKKLINKTISLAELLSYAKPDIQWRSEGMGAFKLRASTNKNDFNIEYEKQKQLLESGIEAYESLYPKVKGIISGSITGKANEGNVYEVYMNLKHSGWAPHPPGPRDPDELTADEIIEKYMDVKRGTQSFVSGGDIGLSQIKLLSAAPSIATLNTIGRALKLILSYIEEGKNANLTIEHVKTKVFSKEFDALTQKDLQELLRDVNESLALEI